MSRFDVAREKSETDNANSSTTSSIVTIFSTSSAGGILCSMTILRSGRTESDVSISSGRFRAKRTVHRRGLWREAIRGCTSVTHETPHLKVSSIRDTEFRLLPLHAFRILLVGGLMTRGWRNVVR